MKKITVMIITAAAIVFAVLSMSGCLIKTVDELYSLPELSERYLQLQDVLNEVLSSGGKYASPAAGSNRQAVQFEDVDGDGNFEALAFINKPGEDNPLRIYIFDVKDGAYQNTAVIEGKGTSVESVYYSDLDGDGTKEITVGWQLSAEMKMLTVYSLTDFNVTPIISTDYTAYTFYDLTGKENVMVFRINAAEGVSEAELYTVTEEKEIVSSSAHLSAGITALRRVRCNNTRGNKHAVYVESEVSSGVVTDIFVYRDGLLNITLDENGVSSGTLRSQNVYCRDIDMDGTLDVPQLIPLETQSDTVYYLTKWYSFNYNGDSTLLETTYHNYSDGWFLKIPDEWGDDLRIRREDGASGERTMVFSYTAKDREVDFLTVYAISGGNRYERAAESGSFTLLEAGSTVYAAKISEGAAIRPLDEKTVKQNLGIIYSEWITGEL